MMQLRRRWQNRNRSCRWFRRCAVVVALAVFQRFLHFGAFDVVVQFMAVVLGAVEQYVAMKVYHSDAQFLVHMLGDVAVQHGSP